MNGATAARRLREDGARRWLRSARFSRALADAMDFLLPPACAGCGGDTGGYGGEAGDQAASEPVCLGCRLRLAPVPLPVCDRCGAPLGTGRAPSCLECVEWPDLLAGARSAALLESPARELVHALKYQGWEGVGRYMGEEMARRAADAVREADFVVPVPTSARNLRRRGYNQAQVIATALADALEVPLLLGLERRRQAGTQTTLNPAQRRANVSGAFVLSESCAQMLEGRRVALVDDVLTTGATLLAAVRALAPGRPASVFAYAFARTVPISMDRALDDELDITLG